MPKLFSSYLVEPHTNTDSYLNSGEMLDEEVEERFSWLLRTLTTGFSFFPEQSKNDIYLDSTIAMLNISFLSS